MTKSPSPSPDALQGWDQSSTCVAIQKMGRSAGKEYGLAEATARTLAQLLRRQAEQKFGGPDAGGTATLDGLAQAFAGQQLWELADRLLTAATWFDWLAGVSVPPPAADMPAYTKNLNIDLEPASPSIDTYVKASLTGGRDEVLIHLRLQKWLQPDLDRVLFESSSKLERQHGTKVMVLVFLMWPSAEGPSIKGRYEDRDAKGRVRSVFTYHIRRAWEIEPEAAMLGVGTMLLAPLTRGAKKRMPEIVQMLKTGLDNFQADEKTRQMIWEAVYWAMGVVCDVEECHRLLADVLPIIESSPNYLAAKGQSYLDGFSAGQRDGPAQAARDLVLRQATARFGPPPDVDALTAMTLMDDLTALSRRVLTATDWASLLAKPGT